MIGNRYMPTNKRRKLLGLPSVAEFELLYKGELDAGIPDKQALRNVAALYGYERPRALIKAVNRCEPWKKVR